MNQDIQKFMELMETDEALQEKLKSAAESYTGEMTPEAAYDNLIIPIAREAGLNFTMEELREYEKQNTPHQLDPGEILGDEDWRTDGQGRCYDPKDS